jgi:cytochrome P450
MAARRRAVTDFDEPDFFTDDSLVPDPYPYFHRLREQCPVRREPRHGIVAVTGYEEALAVYRDSEAYSSVNSVIGPFPQLPFEPEGDDIGALIEQFRDQFPLHEHLVTLDPPTHTRGRELLKRLLTPKRLKENEAFMWRLADRQIEEFVAGGSCELIRDYAKPFALLAIADLLGVPEEDQKAFRIHLGAQVHGTVEAAEEGVFHDPLTFLDDRFTAYIEDRRREPRDDVLTQLAEAKYPDGSTPEVIDVVRIATFLFAAGQDTTAKLLGAAFQVIGERPDLQQQLREDRSRIPTFVEETLRLEGPVKCDFRLARTAQTLAGVGIPVGTSVMILPGAANRDPRRFEDPDEFRLDRGNVREHMAFGRGIHSCPGGPLARVEGRVSIERFLDRMADIRISETEHGPADARRYTHEPTYILRGLTELHLEFTPVA